MSPTIACVAGRRILEVLAASGVRTVLLDHEIPLDVALAVDVPVEADLDNWEATEAALRRVHAVTPVDAVLSVRDSYVPLAGYLAARLGVRGVALHAALNCHDKARMRRALAGAGVPNPEFRVIDDPAEAVTSAAEVGFPVVVKRVRDAGGAGVRLCADVAAVERAVAELSDPDEAVPLLVEQYLDGTEYAVQTVTVDGATEVLSILAGHTGPPPRFAETGYDAPDGLAPDQHDELATYAERVLKALGIDHSVAHVQLRRTADGPRVIEVNPRPPGGAITDVTEALSGVNLLQAAVDSALGRPVRRLLPTASHVRYRCVVFDQAGVVTFDPAVLDDPPDHATVELDIEPGDEVLPVDHVDGGVYGRIVVYGHDDADLDARHTEITKRLALQVRPIAQEER